MRSGFRRGRKSSFARSELRRSSVLLRRFCGPLRRSTYIGELWLRAVVLVMIFAMIEILFRLPGDNRMLTN